MKTIYRGKEINIDSEDLPLLMNYKWHFSTRGYLTRRINSEMVALHRVLINANRDKFVDHIDGDILNLSKSNLRVCTHAQNCYNRNSGPFSSSKYKGVTKRIRKDKKSIFWEVQIRVNNKLIYLGSYGDELEAAKVYDEAADKYFGKFAKVNIQ